MKKITIPSIATTERALEDGVGSQNLFWVADWHQQQAKTAQGIDRERHYQIAAKVKMVANELKGKEVS